jgi:hypothetical protein
MELPKRRRSKARYWFLAGALAALTVWWPLVGFLEGLFWGQTFDAKGPDDLAVDIILAAHDGLASQGVRLFGDIPEVNGRDCLRDLDLFWMKSSNSGPGKDALQVVTALTLERNRVYYGHARWVAEQSLRGMSNPVLGALQSCIAGSLLSSACDAYAVRRVTASLANHRGEFNSRLKDRNESAQNAACSVIDGPFGKARH